ncbi:hypothetical protein LY78DRAFT_468815 [Colletotrichum sublineola]|nr:hypothetical protein LY78DRAFT_468815 [Colletotrichum sublineola]
MKAVYRYPLLQPQGPVGQTIREISQFDLSTPRPSPLLLSHGWAFHGTPAFLLLCSCLSPVSTFVSAAARAIYRCGPPSHLRLLVSSIPSNDTHSPDDCGA